MSGAQAEMLRDAVRTVQALRARLDAAQAERDPPIAVVGVGCRFPGADGPEAFWRLLAEGRDAVRAVPTDRWDNALWHSPDPEAPGRIAFREAAFLDDVDGFDHELFGIAAREAAGMDPQHRLLLETAWSALEDAGIRPDGLRGAPAGVFLGVNGGDHLHAVLSEPGRLGGHALSGAVASLAAGRIAYALGLSGPALVVDTACSSSLVAVHLAVRALRAGECGLALAGGVHLMLAPAVSVALSRARMMAPDGRCKAFDSAADGFGQGEGGGVAALKRLADAEAAGDRVLAVIRGSALNQDGRSAGITAPNGTAQAGVIRAALADARLAPEAIDAVEAHGTGTALGDPVEMHALAAVFGAGRATPLPVGSVKTNIGHTAAAAGVAGLIKAVLMLKHQAVPASLHHRSLNPHIDLRGAPLEVPTAFRERPVRAVGVSSFGFSGTNAHVVLEAPPSPPPAEEPPSAQRPRLLISARSRDELRSLVARYRALLAEGARFEDLCRSAAAGRPRLRWWVSAEDPAALETAEPRDDAPPDLPPQRGRSVPLPPTPFARRRFPRVASAPEGAPGAAFPGRLLDTPSADRQLECVLDAARSPWLADHQVQGRVVVPGAVMIALMLAAASAEALADIHFLEAAVLDAAPLRLVALARPDGTLEVASRAGTRWLRHAAARSTAAEAPPDLPEPSGGAWASRAEWAAGLAALGIGIGPSFRGVARIARAGRAAVAEVEAGEALPGAPFHPALLDAVLQVAGGCLPPEPVLPVGIARLSLHGPLAGPLRVVARDGGERGIDLVASEGGRPVASVEGLRVGRLSAEAAPRLAALAWLPAPSAAPVPAAQPPRVFEAAPGGANLPEALALVRSALAAPRGAPLVFVTRGAAPPVADPGAALFHGLAGALAEEAPELACRCVDAAPGTPEALVRAEIAAAPTGEPLVALRPEGRFVPRLAPAQPPPGRPSLRGTVLVTGATGGVGRLVAEWAASRGAEALLLVARRPAAATAPAAPFRVPVRRLALDIATPGAPAALAEALRGLPPLRAVVHAAGVLRDGLIGGQTAEGFAEVIAPKLGGARALHALTEGTALDHFLLFGSVASLIGAAGQANYAAANAALDAFADWRRSRGLPATAIAWGRWAETGMAATLGVGQAARVGARGVLPMPPERALAALDAAVLLDVPRVLAASFDWARLAEAAPPVFAPLLPGAAAERPAAAAEEGGAAAQVAGLVRLILGQEAEPGTPLVAHGMDSLMAMDLRNRLNRRFGLSLGVSEIMGGADVRALAAAVEAAMAETEELTL